MVTWRLHGGLYMAVIWRLHGGYVAVTVCDVNAQLYGSTYAHPHATVENRYGFTFTAAVASPVVS